MNSRYLSRSSAFGGPGISLEFHPGNHSRNHFGQLFLDSENTGGTGADGTEGKPNQSQQNPEPNKTSSKAAIAAAVLDLLGRNNDDPNAALETLIKRNYKLEQALETAKAGAGQLPDDVKAKVALVDEFGGVDKLRERVTAGDSAISESANLKREGAMRKACEAAGLDYDDFSTRKGVDDLNYEIKTEKRDGKDVEVAHVTFEADGKQQSRPLADWVAEKLPTVAKAANSQTRQAVVTPYGASAPSGGGRPANTFDAIRERKAKQNEAASNGAQSWKQQLGLPE